MKHDGAPAIFTDSPLPSPLTVLSALLDFVPSDYLVYSYWEEGIFRLYKKVAFMSFGTGTVNP